MHYATDFIAELGVTTEIDTNREVIKRKHGVSTRNKLGEEQENMAINILRSWSWLIDFKDNFRLLKHFCQSDLCDNLLANLHVPFINSFLHYLELK